MIIYRTITSELPFVESESNPAGSLFIDDFCRDKTIKGELNTKYTVHCISCINIVTSKLILPFLLPK